METAFLVGTLLSAIMLVVFLIMRAHIQAFVSLIIVCFYVGFVTGMPLNGICKSIEAGMGSTLGFWPPFSVSEASSARCSRLLAAQSG